MRFTPQLGTSSCLTIIRVNNQSYEINQVKNALQSTFLFGACDRYLFLLLTGDTGGYRARQGGVYAILHFAGWLNRRIPGYTSLRFAILSTACAPDPTAGWVWLDTLFCTIDRYTIH